MADRMDMDEVHEMLNDLADEIPLEMFRELNGGIALLPEVKYSPAAKNRDLYILGEYRRGGSLGRLIRIYYGSMMAAFPNASKEKMKRELRRVLRHEFRHHLESLAGNMDLEIEDAAFIHGYLSKHREDP